MWKNWHQVRERMDGTLKGKAKGSGRVGGSMLMWSDGFGEEPEDLGLILTTITISIYFYI